MTATAAKKRSKKAKDEENQAQAVKAMEETAPPSEAEEKYRATPLASIAFTTNEAKKFEEAEVETVGDLEDAFFEETRGKEVLLRSLGMTAGESQHIVGLLAMHCDAMEEDAKSAASAEPETIAEDVAKVVDKALEKTDTDADVENLLEEHRKAKAFDEIDALNSEVSQAFDRWFSANEHAKAKKKTYEAAVIELREFIHRIAHPEAMPLFDKTGADGEEDGDDEPTKEVNPPDESWRDIPLREALPELTETIHGKLEGAQLFTFGELANWTAENGGRRRLTDIAGIGAGTAGKIEEATMSFWQRWKPSANGQPDDNAKVQSGFASRRKFLDTKFSDLGIGDGPLFLLEGAKLTTVGELEMSASLASVGIFDKLKSLGMDDAEATTLIEKLNTENARLAAEGGA